jgi:hypothetical protein
VIDVKLTREKVLADQDLLDALLLGKLWTTSHQWKLSLSPTGISALSQVPLRGRAASRSS